MKQLCRILNYNNKTITEWMELALILLYHFMVSMMWVTGREGSFICLNMLAVNFYHDGFPF